MPSNEPIVCEATPNLTVTDARTYHTQIVSDQWNFLTDYLPSKINMIADFAAMFLTATGIVLGECMGTFIYLNY